MRNKDIRGDGSRATPGATSGVLRSIHDATIFGPSPDRFARLLNQLGEYSMTHGHSQDWKERTPTVGWNTLGALTDQMLETRVEGDDYLCQPATMVELMTKIEALLRRHPAEHRDSVLWVGPLELDLIGRAAKRGERKISLLPREFLLLEYMMRRKDQILTRATLLQEVWNYKFVPETNRVDVHMGQLRRKVDEPHEPQMIFNVRGVGFILRTPEFRR